MELTSYPARCPRGLYQESEDCPLDHQVALVTFSRKHPTLPQGLFVAVLYGSKTGQYCLVAAPRLEYGCTAQ